MKGTMCIFFSRLVKVTCLTAKLQEVDFSSAISQVETIKLYKLLNTAEKAQIQSQEEVIQLVQLILRHRISIGLCN